MFLEEDFNKQHMSVYSTQKKFKHLSYIHIYFFYCFIYILDILDNEIIKQKKEVVCHFMYKYANSHSKFVSAICTDCGAIMDIITIYESDAETRFNVSLQNWDPTEEHPFIQNENLFSENRYNADVCQSLVEFKYSNKEMVQIIKDVHMEPFYFLYWSKLQGNFIKNLQKQKRIVLLYTTLAGFIQPPKIDTVIHREFNELPCFHCVVSVTTEDSQVSITIKYRMLVALVQHHFIDAGIYNTTFHTKSTELYTEGNIFGFN